MYYIYTHSSLLLVSRATRVLNVFEQTTLCVFQACYPFEVKVVALKQLARLKKVRKLIYFLFIQLTRPSDALVIDFEINYQEEYFTACMPYRARCILCMRLSCARSTVIVCDRPITEQTM